MKHVPIGQVISFLEVYTKGEYFIELVNSIREHGILNPIVIDDQYKIVDGNHRYAAAKAAGFDEVPVVIIRRF